MVWRHKAVGVDAICRDMLFNVGIRFHRSRRSSHSLDHEHHVRGRNGRRNRQVAKVFTCQPPSIAYGDTHEDDALYDAHGARARHRTNKEKRVPPTAFNGSRLKVQVTMTHSIFITSTNVCKIKLNGALCRPFVFPFQAPTDIRKKMANRST